MAKFKVQLQRTVDGIRNPFRCLHIGRHEAVRVNVREWEFEAKDEAHVRKFYNEAVAQDLDNVRGYHIRSIEKISD